MAEQSHYSFSYFCDDFIMDEKINTFLTSYGFKKVDDRKYWYSVDKCTGSVKYQLQNKMIYLTVHPHGKRSVENKKFNNMLFPLIKELSHN